MTPGPRSVPVLAAGLSEWLEPQRDWLRGVGQSAVDNWAISATWAGLFVATVFLVRMLWTRWGENNVTGKAIALSLLIHAVGGLWTTTVHLATGAAVVPQTERLPVRRVVVESSPDQPRADSQGRPLWDQLPEESPNLTRVSKAPNETSTARPDRLRLPSEEVALLSPTMISPRDRTSDDPAPSKREDVAMKTSPERANRPIQEETAESRTESGETGPNRTDLSTPDRNSVTPSRMTRTEVSQGSGSDDGLPLVNVPSREVSPDAARRAAEGMRPAATKAKGTIPAEEGGEADTGVATAPAGGVAGGAFSRSGLVGGGRKPAGTAMERSRPASRGEAVAPGPLAVPGALASAPAAQDRMSASPAAVRDIDGVIARRDRETPQIRGINGTLRGSVTNAETGGPLAKATIRLDRVDGPPLTTLTDERGMYVLPVPKVPDDFAVSAIRSGFTPESRNMRVEDLHRQATSLNFVLRPDHPKVIALEKDPAVHHLGNDLFQGQINSQFQLPSEGNQLTLRFDMTEGQARLRTRQAVVTFLAKGMECPPRLYLNGQPLQHDLTASPENGSFGKMALLVDAALLQTGENRFTIESTNCRGDLDDFEVVNIQVHLVYNPPK